MNNIVKRGALRGFLAFVAVVCRDAAAEEPRFAEADAAIPEATAIDLTAVLRDPFWPIGYTPPAPEKDAGEAAAIEPEREPPDWSAAAALLEFRGGFRAGKRNLGWVNGRIVEAGNIIGVRRNPWIYQWRIKAVDRRGIEVEPLGVVPAE